MSHEEQTQLNAQLGGADYLPSLAETAAYLGENPKMDDLLYVGGTITPQSLISGYEKGLFPMFVGQDEDEAVGWFSPQLRAGLDLAPYAQENVKIKVHRSLIKSMRNFIAKVDTDFRGVLDGCAFSRDQGNWIDQRFADVYLELHHLGLAHSVEIYLADEPDQLVGGLYGVGIGGLFSGESMFHTVTDASKAAFVAAVRLLNQAGFAYIDGQWLTSHLENLGMREVRRRDYLARLPSLIGDEPDPILPHELVPEPSRWLDMVIG